MLTRTRDEWFVAITATGGSAAPCLEASEVIEDPQVAARGLIWNLQHPSAGSVRQWGFPILFADEPASFRSFAPLPGEHTATLLSELGYSPQAIEQIRGSQKGTAE
jgi:crotonobetainyl-CoA:carnitine CoA-transferase CaiB-like acyl-CoA transferase